MPALTNENTQNHILRSLSREDRERVEDYLEPAEMPNGMLIYDAEQTIEHIYFPNHAVISVVSSTESGETAEAGLIGREGITGIEAFYDGPAALNRHIVQLPGEGFRAELAELKAEFARGSSFQSAVFIFTRSMLAQTSQTALCNRIHIAERRLAKWLLMCRDRSNTDVLHITQEFAATMLGTNRVTLTQAAGQLQDRSLIQYKRGFITIIDRKGLEAAACECYAKIKEEYGRYKPSLS